MAGFGNPTVALVVDNPLRDLEGLVLLAHRLAVRGTQVFLVPMYDQGFDVPVLAPDMVLVNYTRPNNADLIRGYKRRGILVGVLDTEGGGGNNPDHVAEMISATGIPDEVDLYCTWGQGQHDAFLRRGRVKPDRLAATGCPRYDFCAKPWNQALARPEGLSNYILINTNFPTVNPRFSSGSDDEISAMTQVGLSDDFSRRFIADARHAHAQVKTVVERLADRFPEVIFVLRPHPFENLSSYDALAEHDNIVVRQEGTSLEWIAQAKLLIHQNCSTAVEAVMLGVEPFSMEWFNSDALRLDSATRVSWRFESETALTDAIARAMVGETPSPDAAQTAFREKMLHDFYFSIDGCSSDRVADAVLTTISDARNGRRAAVDAQLPSVRGRIVETLRSGFGFKGSAKLRRAIWWSSQVKESRAGKHYTIETVCAILDRIQKASPNDGRFEVSRPTGLSRYARWMAGSGSLVIKAVRG